MSEFKREERYIVVKLKHLAGLQVAPLRNFLRENRVPTLDCVVVESDWPEYEPVWQMIERRMTGQPVADFDRVTADLASANADKEAYAQNAIDLRKRVDALQQRLTAADERNDRRDSEIFAQVQSALRRSFSLGQIYWQQADSDSTRQQNKSDQTMEVQEQHILNVLKSLGAALNPAEGGGDDEA